MREDSIIIRGGRQHNLKNINVEIPRNKLVVITGLSGSGKSSLAFDTIYAEGQRRYVESLSVYARQFLEQMQKPDVDVIEGLSPAIAIEQRTVAKNPRSTVGTTTEIYDYLRLLFARIGTPHCYVCGKTIRSQTPQEISDHIMDLPEGSRVEIMAPLVRDRKGEYRKLFDDVRKEGYVKVRVDGTIYDVADDIVLERNRRHSVDVVVDRLIMKAGMGSRVVDSVETALHLGGGIVRVGIKQPSQPHMEVLYSEHFACPDCQVSFEELSPRMFSFNSPHGACPECTGLGTTMELDPELVVPDKSVSLADDAVRPWRFGRKVAAYYRDMLAQVSRHYGFDYRQPFGELEPRFQEIVLYGSGSERIMFEHYHNGARRTFERPFEGVLPNLARRFRETHSAALREMIAEHMSVRPCPVCKGGRLKPESLAVTVGGRSIAEISAMTIKEAAEFFDKLKLSPTQQLIARRILREIRERLGFLIHVGVEYLTLDRQAGTLAGGESQRIRLATQIGAGLVGVLYILDEPTIGLHQRDNSRLLGTLTHLRDMGNTVIVVEHDEETIRSADFVIDLGPGAGAHGGEIVAAGVPAKIQRSPRSLTGKYLTGKLRIGVPEARRRPGAGALVLHGVRHNNLKEITVSFPLRTFICVTGVSGSGKSSLVDETLYPVAASALHGAREKAGAYDRIEGLELIDKVINIDQSPIGRTPRSNPATYTGVFTHIRELFAMTPDARVRGYKPGRFSFNVKGGRCEACLGGGMTRIEMHFLPDVYVVCDLCGGQRYNRETLEVKFKGMNIAEVLDMTVENALKFFANVPALKQKLQTLQDVGLGYIKLGQSSTTLSGGEAQRVKLSAELARKSTGRTLYLLDEPTTGLHLADIEQLLAVLHRLVSAGNTVIVIEHNLDVIKTADHVIDLGPEGGDAGGYIVAGGTPEEVAECESSYTGMFLKQHLRVPSRSVAGVG
jgi:excinuclease ABC subunit A